MTAIDITFAITNACNLRCKMCNIWAERPIHALAIEDISRVLQAISKRATIGDVSITGGECFLHPNIEKILILLVQLRAKNIIAELDIVTNGYFTEKLQDIFTRNKDLFQNVKWSVDFSVDGLQDVHDTQRGNTQSFQRIVQTLDYLREFKTVSTSIKFCATNENHADLYPLFLWCKEQGLGFAPKLAEFDLSAYYHKDTRPLRTTPHTPDVLASITLQLKHIIDENENTVPIRAVQEILKDLDLRKKDQQQIMKDTINMTETSSLTAGHTPTSCNTPLLSVFVDAQGNVFPCVYYPPICNIHTLSWESSLFGPTHCTIIKEGKGRTCPGCLAYHGLLKPFNFKHHVSFQTPESLISRKTC